MQIRKTQLQLTATPMEYPWVKKELENTIF